MTAPAPLVLGLGNLILGDDAVGLALLEALARSGRWGDRVEFVDGGTRGLPLLAVLAGRPAVVVLDAVARGAPPGAVHVLDAEAALGMGGPGAGTAHEGGAAALLRAARLTGDLPAWVRVVGVEPAHVATGMDLSPAVRVAFETAIARAGEAVDAMLAAVQAPAPGAPTARPPAAP